MSHHSICLLIFLLVFGSFLSACSSKIPYGSTYYFPLEPKATTAKKTVEPEQLQVSIDRLIPLKPSVATQLEEANIKISRWVLPATEEVIINQSQAFHTVLSKKEQKKAVKAQVKALKSEIKQAKKQQKQEQQRPTKNLRNGIILGAAGLIMMIIFGAAGIGILVGIGAIVLVVGIVLILLDLLEV